jgi:hypothetical protein
VKVVEHLIASAEVDDTSGNYVAYVVTCSCGTTRRLAHRRTYFTGPVDIGAAGLVFGAVHEWMLLLIVLLSWDVQDAARQVRELQAAGAPYNWAWNYLKSQRP